jgi:hypothetical protein
MSGALGLKEKKSAYETTPHAELVDFGGSY